MVATIPNDTPWSYGAPVKHCEFQIDGEKMVTIDKKPHCRWMVENASDALNNTMAAICTHIKIEKILNVIVEWNNIAIIAIIKIYKNVDKIAIEYVEGFKHSIQPWLNLIGSTSKSSFQHRSHANFPSKHKLSVIYVRVSDGIISFIPFDGDIIVKNRTCSFT